MAKALQDNFGVKQGLMTTIHGYTGDQMILMDHTVKVIYVAQRKHINIKFRTGAAKVSVCYP